MKFLLIADLETTTADPATAAIVEVACCLWDIEARTVLSVYSTTVHAIDNPAEHINGIPQAALADAPSVNRALASVGHFVAKSDLICAHNGDSFDRPVLEQHACPWVDSKPWVDTMDFEFPRFSSSRSLIALAAAHGVPIGTVHRAVDDVLLVARLLERAAELGADIRAMVEKAMRPKVRVAAVTPKPWEIAEAEWQELKGRLLAAGFRFDSVKKSWERDMPVDDIAGLEFEARVVA